MKMCVFEIIKNKQGLVGIKYLHGNGVVTVICHSPYASPRSKSLLEQEILRAYYRYYRRVRREAMGEFYNNDSLIKFSKGAYNYD